MDRRTLAKNLLLGAAALAIGACNRVGPQPKRDGQPPPAAKSELYEVDLSKPDGPMYQILRAAQERDEDLFKASFAPTVDMTKFDDAAFRKFRKKVLSNKITPVPESVQQLSDTEAIVKMRNAKGGEMPIKVQKIDGKWYVAGFDFRDKGKQRYKDQKAQKAS